MLILCLPVCSLSLNSYENHTKVLTLRIRLYPNYLPFIADGGMDLMDMIYKGRDTLATTVNDNE